MTDNIFDRLAELLQSSGPVNWRLAREIGESVAGPAEPIEPWIAEEYRELTSTAVLRISEASPLDPAGHVVDVRAVDRRTWVGANIEAFSYLAEPLAEKMSAQGGGSLGPVLGQLAPALLGMQVGAMTGFLSQRVLGQFDIGLPAAAGTGIFYVVPNIEAFADENDLDVRQARLWVALHEVAHHAEFALPWVRPHFLELVRMFFEGIEFDLDALGARLEDFQGPEDLQHMLEGSGGLGGIEAGPEQEALLGRIQAFMAVMEGYGDYLMDRAAPGLIPEASRLRAAVADRRAAADDGRGLEQLLGLEMKHDQYGLGLGFCEEVARRWGEDTLTRMWEGPDMLPDFHELDDVVGWAARVLLEG